MEVFIKNFILVILLHSLTFSFAEANSNLCTESHLSIISKLKGYENRLAFSNDGGLFNAGVCWWHSRFERAAAYLAVYRPSHKKPSSRELKNILEDISHMRPVMIPGYRNLQDLSSSSENEEIIQKVLNAWQLRDGFINQAWRKGLSGRPRMEATKFKNHMKEIYLSFLKERKPYFLMLQMPGLVAHAFLLLNIRLVNKGYELQVVDSNSPGRLEYFYYEEGSTSMQYYGKDFVPYLGFAVDLNKISNGLEKICRK
jgi:hypothetical protein